MVKQTYAFERWTKESWLLVDAVKKIVDTECKGKAGLFPFKNLSTPTVKKLVTMAKQFDEKARALPLSFEYFELVAGRKDAVELLTQAAKERWSANELRGKIAVDRVERSPLSILRADYEPDTKVRFESCGKTNFVQVFRNRHKSDVIVRIGSVLLNRSDIGVIYRMMGNLQKIRVA